jgi:processive 1,2-diacylglycerol beta-glucosyltransferase
VSAPKVLLAYASVGSGHEQAARALGEVFAHRGWQTVYVDYLEEVPAPMRFVMRDAYLELVRILPEAYDLAFQRTVTLDFKEAEQTLHLLAGIGSRQLRDLALHEAPDTIVSTNILSTLALAGIKQRHMPTTTMVNCFTDYVLQTLYLIKGVNWHVSANEQLTAAFRASHRRVRQPIYSFGIPIRPAFAVHRSRREARRILGIPEDAHLALVMGGGLGLGHVLEACDTLTSKPFGEPITAIALCGNNTTLQEQVRGLAVARLPRHTIMAVGWTDQVPVYMQAADLLVSKAGGVSLAEAAAVGVPVVIFQHLPGQETVNVQFLTQHEAVIAADDPEQLLHAAEELLFTDRGPVLAGNLRRLGKPTAASDIVARVCEDLDHPVEKESA